MNRLACLCLLSLTVVGLPGCRTSDSETNFARIINEPVPLTAAERAEFGVVGVLPAGLVSEFNFRPPKNFPATFDYTTEKTFNQLERDTRAEHERLETEPLRYGFIGALMLAAGTMSSIFASVPDAQLKRGRAALAQALHDEPLEPIIHKGIAAWASTRQLTNVVTIPEAALARLGSPNATTNDYRALAGNGFDSVLVMHMWNQGFAAHESVNPPMAFCAQLDVQVVRIADGKVLSASVLMYKGHYAPFNRWVANDANLFREELKLSGQTFVEAVMEQMFATPKPGENK